MQPPEEKSSSGFTVKKIFTTETRSSQRKVSYHEGGHEKHEESDKGGKALNLKTIFSSLRALRVLRGVTHFSFGCGFAEIGSSWLIPSLSVLRASAMQFPALSSARDSDFSTPFLRCLSTSLSHRKA